MVISRHLGPAACLAVVLLCLVLPVPALVSARHSPSGYGRTLKSGEGDTKGSDVVVEHPLLGDSQILSVEQNTGSANEKTQEILKDCFSLPESTTEPCEFVFESRELVDYGPPVGNPDVRPGVPAVP